MLVDGQNVAVRAVVCGTAPEEITELTTKITAGQTATIVYAKSEDESEQIGSIDGEALESFGPVDVTFFLPAPDLKADTTDNVVGKCIDLTFIDDEGWRNRISEVSVDGQVLQQDGDTGYTVDAGIITIAADIFTSAKTYTIVVKADGYQDAIIMQTIKEKGQFQVPLTMGTSC